MGSTLKVLSLYHLNYKNNTVQTVKLILKSKLHIETRFPVFSVFIPLNSLDRIGLNRLDQKQMTQADHVTMALLKFDLVSLH